VWFLKKKEIVKRFGTCSKDCYGSCVFIGEWDDKVEEKKFLRAIPSKDHKFTRGFFCSKFSKRENLIYHPERLKNALERVGPKGTNDFKEIEIEVAIKKIFQIILKVLDESGPESIVGSYYAGNFGLISKLSPLRFFNRLGATITTGGICNEAGSAALKQMFGFASLTNPFQLIDHHTKLIVVWGSNLSERNLHAYTLIKQALENGVKLVVIDTRKHELADKSHLFLQPFPGTEFLVAKLLISQIVKSQEYDYEFITAHLENATELFEIIEDLEEEKILAQTGLKRSDITKACDLLKAHNHETIFNLGFGVQKYHHGGDTVHLISLIQVLLGNLGKMGTGIIYDQGSFSDYYMNPVKQYITGMPNLSADKEIKLVDLGWALNSSKYKMLFIYNFNPASSLPNLNLVRKTFSREDLTIVVLDPFLTETTRYADFVIPSKLGVENDDIYAPYYVPGVSINEGGPCPYQNCLTNYEFFQRIARNIGLKDDFQETQETIFKNCIELLPNSIKKKVINQGYYIQFKENEIPLKDLFSLTSNKKISINKKILSENPFIPELKDPNEFYLISPSHQNYIHSQFGQINKSNLQDFDKIFLYPLDIQRLNLKKDTLVLVSNRYGQAEYILDESIRLRPGVALIYSGSPLSSANGSNVNLFTPQDPEISRLSGSYNSTTIKILIE
jgi:anaerobic selenocysteine-containing dehydrogenase